MNKLILKAMKIPEVVEEYKFHPTRKWRIDYAIPSLKLAIEIEGGCFVKGRHVNPMGFIKDMEKYNALTEMGWLLLRYQPTHIDYEQIERVCKMLGECNAKSE